MLGHLKVTRRDEVDAIYAWYFLSVDFLASYEMLLCHVLEDLFDSFVFQVFACEYPELTHHRNAFFEFASLFLAHSDSEVFTSECGQLSILGANYSCGPCFIVQEGQLSETATFSKSGNFFEAANGYLLRLLI